MDDKSAQTDAAAPAKPTRERKGSKTRNYSDAALVANQAPVTALIPARAWTLSVLLLSGVTLVALLNLLHALLPRLGRWIGPEQVDALNFAVRGNLAAWFSAFLLGYAAVMSVQIFNLRRHRVDDYKGRYRCWIWLTVLLAGASVDAATGLHDIVGGLIVKLSKATTFSPGAGWLLLAAIIVTCVSIRMAIEMRRSIGTLVALTLALGCYALAAVVRLGWLPLDAELGWHTLVSSTLLGHLLVCFTTLAYGAHVYLDAQGLLVKKPKVAKPKKKKEDDKPAEEKAEASTEKTVAGAKVRIDNAHSEPAAKASGGPLKAAISAATNKSPPADDRRMSKAERKRQRRSSRDEDGDEDE